MPQPMAHMIQLRNISKRFGQLQALDDVSLDIRPMTVVGLLGENGAGKSTLMQILFGLIKPDTGTVTAGGRAIRSPRAAAAMGIGMVHQHFKLVPTLTAMENFALFLRRRPVLLRRQVEQWLRQLSWELPLVERVELLTVGQQQRVEILKALLTIHDADEQADAEEAGVSPTLILDEPTAVLTPQETAELFTAVRRVRDAGTAVVFISHKLEEVRHICDTLAILRRGKIIYAAPMGEQTAESIAEKMVGARVEMPQLSRDRGEGNKEPCPPTASARADEASAAPVLAVHDVSTDQLKSVSLELHPREILGIAGVDGNGQSHIVQAILATRKIAGGAIAIAGRDAAGMSTRARLDRIAFIAEDRQREALVLPLSIEDNLLLKDYRDNYFSMHGWLRFGRWRKHAESLMAKFDIRATSAKDIAGQLSGGNQQKVVVARELYAGTLPIVLAVNPTRGLDVGATAFVLRQLLEARNRGAGVLLIHPDLDELLAVSDRVAVLYNGTLTATRWPDTTKEAIGRLMLGLPATEAA